MKKETENINLQPSHVRAYRFIEKYIKKNIVSPEIKEVAVGIKITERQTYRLIDDMKALGYLSNEMYKKRSLKIAKPLQ